MFVIWLWGEIHDWWEASRAPAPPRTEVAALRYAKYFRPAPDPNGRIIYRVLGHAGDLLLLVAVVPLVDRGVVAAAVLAGLGLVLSCTALARKIDHERAVTGLEPKPDDAEMDDRLADLLLGVDAQALAALHLTAADVVATGVTWNAAAAVRGDPVAVGGRDAEPHLVLTPVLAARSAVGRDGRWRFTRYDVVALCPTPHHIAVFRCRVDVISGRTTAAETEEYYYEDVTAVMTKGASSDDVLFNPVDHFGLGWTGTPRLTRRELHFASPGVDRTVVAVHQAPKPRQRPKPASGAQTVAVAPEVTVYDSGLDAAAEAVRRLLRAKRGGPATAPAV